jgi:dolichol-phosphate mannosyltransferase
MKKMIKLGTAGILGFSDKPLYLAVASGFIVMGVAFLGLIWVLLSSIFGWGDLVRGWASIALIVMFFAAVQLIFLGVIGIYISHVFTETKQRPLFIIRNPRQ